MLERRGGISKAMAVTVDLVFATKLNDESTWISCTLRDQEYRRLLFWTVYYMDRRVALKVNRPIMIRENDFDVGDFTLDSKKQYMKDSLFAIVADEGAQASNPLLQWPQPSKPTEDWFEYLMFNVRWSTMATGVWDSFFSLRAMKTADFVKASSADQMLTGLQKSLPSSIQWDAKRLPKLLQMGETDRAFRLRLYIFEVRNAICSRNFHDRCDQKTSTIDLTLISSRP